jgi:glycosyltransferase involved in cell wall biosynthesis
MSGNRGGADRDTQAVPVSVIVPVKNEALHLERCLSSVKWADEIFVVDSQSTDETASIARRLGARVVQFRYTAPWPKKKNWALETLPLRNGWVLLLDADEVLPPRAETEIRDVVSSGPSDIRGYWINRRFLFMNRWLTHAYYPNWNLRLFQHQFGRFERLTSVDTESGDVEIHEHVFVEGPTARLTCEMEHYAFPTVSAFVDKHNRYSSWEAHVTLDPISAPRGPSRFRSKLRYWARYLPCRSLLRFLYVYIWQRAFLDGREGYYFARLHGVYEFLSVAKTYELQRGTTKNHHGTGAL